MQILVQIGLDLNWNWTELGNNEKIVNNNSRTWSEHKKTTKAKTRKARNKTKKQAEQKEPKKVNTKPAYDKNKTT